MAFLCLGARELLIGKVRCESEDVGTLKDSFLSEVRFLKQAHPHYTKQDIVIAESISEIGRSVKLNEYLQRTLLRF